MPVAVPQPDPHSLGGILVHMPHVCSVCINYYEKFKILKPITIRDQCYNYSMMILIDESFRFTESDLDASVRIFQI